MSKTRLGQLEAISVRLSEIRNELEAIMRDEEEYRDGMTEDSQSDDDWESADRACFEMWGAIEQIDDAISSVDAVL